MPSVGAPAGNDNARKRRDFERTIYRAIQADDGKRLRKAAETILDLAAAGERWACELLRDTLDGKPAQQIIAQDDQGRPLNVGLFVYSADTATISIQAPALPAPSPEEPGQRH